MREVETVANREKGAVLRSLNLFEGLSDAEIEQMSRSIRRVHRRRPGEKIGRGMLDDRVYLVKQGLVRLSYLTPAGDEVVVDYAAPGHVIGMRALVEGAPDDIVAEAVEESYVCEIEAHDLFGLLARHPVLMARVLVATARSNLALEHKVASLATEPVSARLADHLLSQLARAEPVAEGYLLPPQHQVEIAKIIGAARESVARTLAVWRRRGVIRVCGRRIVLREKEALEAIRSAGRSAHGHGAQPRRDLKDEDGA